MCLLADLIADWSIGPLWARYRHIEIIEMTQNGKTETLFEFEQILVYPTMKKIKLMRSFDALRV
jgi:hypothetical protein